MPKLRDHDPVTPAFFDRAPARVVLHQDVPASADALFASFADAAAWKAWLGIDVEWTSPPGPDATRIVRTVGAEIHERFFLWEPGQGVAFFFELSPLPIRAFAEDYRITPTGPTSSRLTWTIAIDGNPVIARGVALVMRINGMRALPKLARFLRDNPSGRA